MDVQDTRISRGDGGSVFVLVKDVSFPSDLPASTTAIVPIADTPQASGVAGTITTPATTVTPTAPAPYLSVSNLPCPSHCFVADYSVPEPT